MPSYKIYKISSSSRILEDIPEDWATNVKIPTGSSENIRRKINLIAKNTKNGAISQEKTMLNGERLVISYQHRLIFGKQDVWISESLDILRKDDLLLIQKTVSKSDFLIEKQLSESLVQIIFKEKQLLKLWRKMKKQANQNGHSIKLHRIIINKTFLNADEIKELNIHAKDVSEIDIFGELTKLAGKIRVITVKIGGIAKDNKPFTVRIGQNSIQIYGNHTPESILKFVNYLI